MYVRMYKCMYVLMYKCMYVCTFVGRKVGSLKSAQVRLCGRVIFIGHQECWCHTIAPVLSQLGHLALHVSLQETEKRGGSCSLILDTQFA